MENIKLIEGDQPAFILEQDGEKLGEMDLQITGDVLTVLHTEVSPKMEGKGLAKMLLERMVSYARENKLMVIPRCSYVHAQFKRQPEVYDDIWKKG